MTDSKKNVFSKEIVVKAEARLEDTSASELSGIQKLVVNSSTIRVLEFLTGIVATVADKPSNLILSGGRLAQALFKGEWYKQLYAEIQGYRKAGRISDEQLESSQGKILFVELMCTIDEENLDETKYGALKAIFIKAIGVEADEQSQMLAYQYFQVCKKLSSFDILLLKTAFEIYESPAGKQRSSGIYDWEKRVSETLGVPIELVAQSRLKNSGISQTPNTIIFDAERQNNRHGLTGLGIEIAKHVVKDL